MERKINEIGIAQLNPYVRLAHYVNEGISSKHFVPWRILYDFEIIFVTKGVLRVVKQNTSYDLHEGSLHIMPPFVRHTRLIPEGVTTCYYSVHLDFMYDESSIDFSAKDVYQKPCDEAMSSVEDDVVLRDNRKGYELKVLEELENYTVSNKTAFLELFAKIKDLYESGEECDSIKLKANVLLLISEIISDLKNNGKQGEYGEDFVTQFMDYTMNHYMNEIDLDKLVLDYGISKSRFRAIFKKKMDQAPLEYVISYRIEQSKKLLLSKKYTVSEVSYMVGYDNIHYFSRLFKQKVGCSPLQFLKQDK